MLIPFVKMQAQGNDFVLLDSFAAPIPNIDPTSLAAELCRFHTGIGADGLVLLKACKTADAQMLIYNSDGTQAEMCGSALRCVSQLLYTRTGRSKLSIKTDSGIKQAEIHFDGKVSVNIGKPVMLCQNYAAEGFTGDLIDIGNLHYVIWEQDLTSDPHLQYGSALEHHEGFPKPVNVHFAELVNRNEVTIKIWEHACGATLACGTGAASTVFSGIQKGDLDSEVQVNMPGGRVLIKSTINGYILQGEVSETFRGVFQWRT